MLQSSGGVSLLGGASAPAASSSSSPLRPNAAIWRPQGRRAITTRRCQCSPSSSSPTPSSPPVYSLDPPARVVIDWRARRKERVVQEIVDSGKKVGRVFDRAGVEEGVIQLEALLPGPPGFEPNMESMKASDWGAVLLDAPMVANRLVQLKMHFPGMNLSQVVAKRPHLLLRSSEDIDKDATAVKKLLATAKNMDKLLEEVPQLLSPKVLLSVLVTVNKWYNLQKDPIEVLENDPDLIRRAQEMDAPFEPVYEDENGNYEAPQLNYKEKRADWQAYIDRTVFKRT